MYEETVLPIRSKFRISSGSRTRIYFIRNSTGQSLIFLKYIELIACLLCLGLAIVTFNTVFVETLEKATVFIINSCNIILIMVEILYPYFRSHTPVILQMLGTFTNFALCFTNTFLLHKINNSKSLIRTITITNGFASVIFLVDFICKIVISTYLHKTTRIKMVKDVGVSAFIPFPSPQKSRPTRAVVTATPITYGGTFPIGKDEPPFHAGDRNPPKEMSHYLDKGIRYKNNFVHTPSKYEYEEYFLDRSPKNKVAQTYLAHEDKGTFAVNRELVPISQTKNVLESLRLSPRTTNKFIKKTKDGSSKSEGSSPRRLENISEERFSQNMSSNCSLKRSKCELSNNISLPGFALNDLDYIQQKRIKFN